MWNNCIIYSILYFVTYISIQKCLLMVFLLYIYICSFGQQRSKRTAKLEAVPLRFKTRIKKLATRSNTIHVLKMRSNRWYFARAEFLTRTLLYLFVGQNCTPEVAQKIVCVSQISKGTSLCCSITQLCYYCQVFPGFGEVRKGRIVTLRGFFSLLNNNSKKSFHLYKGKR